MYFGLKITQDRRWWKNVLIPALLNNRTSRSQHTPATREVSCGLRAAILWEVRRIILNQVFDLLTPYRLAGEDEGDDGTCPHASKEVVARVAPYLQASKRGARYARQFMCDTAAGQASTEQFKLSGLWVTAAGGAAAAYGTAKSKMRNGRQQLLAAFLLSLHKTSPCDTAMPTL